MELSQLMHAIIFMRASLIVPHWCATLASITLQEGRGVTAKQGVKIQGIDRVTKNYQINTSTSQSFYGRLYDTYHSGEIV